MLNALINGFDMYWSDMGHGPPVVFLHGFPLDHQMWQPQIDYFTYADWRIISPDLRGYGLSAAPDNRTITPDLMADDVVALLDYLGIGKAVFVGFSMGGYICFSLFRNHPDRIKALVLANTKSEPDSPEARENRLKLREEVLKRGSSAAAEANVPKLFSPETYKTKQDLVAKVAGIIENINPETIINTLPGLADRPDSTPLLHQINVPVLVIHGKDDQLMPVEKAREMAKAIPDWQFISVPHGGHMANLENPNLYNQSLEAFLKEKHY